MKYQLNIKIPLLVNKLGGTELDLKLTVIFHSNRSLLTK